MLTYVACLGLRRSPYGQQHRCGHADRKAAVAVVDAQADLERLDVALGAAHVALRGKARVDAAIEDRPWPLDARGQSDRQGIADAHAVDVGFLDVGSNP